MRKFSHLLCEDKDSEELLRAEITKYNNAVRKVVPVNVKNTIYLTDKYNVTSKEDLETIRTATKSALPRVAKQLDLDIKAVEDLWSSLKDIKGDYKLLPQYLSKAEREMIEAGRMALDDLTIDLETRTGQNAVAKLYTPLVLKIVNQQLPKRPNMTRQDMISSGMEGLWDAMKTWKREPDKKTNKVVSFKTYASYRILQQIMNDANSTYQLFAGRNDYNIKKDIEKYGSSILYGVSLDALTGSGGVDDDDLVQDRLPEIGVEDKPDSRQEQKDWSVVFKELERKFSQKDMDIFYRYFGVNGYKRETGPEIAKSYNTTPQNINNGYLAKVLKYIRKNRQLMSMLQDIRDTYMESILPSMVDLGSTQIIERLAQDDIYLLLTEATRWTDKSQFIRTVKDILKDYTPEEREVLAIVLSSGFDTLDLAVRKDNQLLQSFLVRMYPTQSFQKFTDGDIIEYMGELQDYCEKYKLNYDKLS